MRRVFVLFIDISILFVSILFSFQILNYLGILEEYKRNIEAFFSIAVYIVPIYLGIAYIFGMASLQRKSILEILYTVFIVSVIFTISLTAILFFRRDEALGFPRSVIGLSGIIYMILLSVWRIVIQKVYTKTHGRRTALLIGNDTDDIQEVLNIKFNKLYQVRYKVAECDASLESKINEVQDVFVSDDISAELRNKLLLWAIEKPDLNLFFIPKMTDIPIINSRIYPFGDLPIHTVSKLYLRPEEKFVKRVIDIFISSVLMVVSFPFLLGVSLIIKLDGGPVFFIQERLTRDRKVFRMIKLRTMKPDAEHKTGPMLSVQKDKRITTIGKFLRATRLDELPQFWNILKGEMSLVGPRPEREFFAEKIEEVIPEFKYRLNVKAGLTGLAQISGKYNTDFRKKLLYDLYYINNFSIFKDFLILLQTIRVIFWKENSEAAREGQPFPRKKNKWTENEEEI